MSFNFSLSQRYLFTIYWALCFLATHIPPSEVPHSTIPHIDKVVHFGIYFGLAFWGVLARVAPRKFLFLVLVFYAAVDELTQPWFQRDANIWDFLWDNVGLAIGFAASRYLPSRYDKP